MKPVRMGTLADLPAVGATLAAAFEDDPVWRFLVPSPRRWRRAPALFRAEAVQRLSEGRVHLTAGAEAVALWGRPGAPENRVLDLLRIAPSAARLFGRRALVAEALEADLKRRRPAAPHWYLAVLGTHPAEQGRGAASAVLAPILDRCDAEGLPAYLESSKEANLAFYARFGFSADHPIVPVAGCPPLWPMRREPR